MKVYHYTKGIHLEKIIESGVINTEPSSYGEDDILNNKKAPQLHAKYRSYPSNSGVTISQMRYIIRTS